MPHMALNERDYKGKVYQTHAAATQDLIRVGGKGVEGAFVPAGPLIVAEQLPGRPPRRRRRRWTSCRPTRSYGAGSRTSSPAILRHYMMLEKTVPVALKKGKPGTPEFRAALRDAFETMKAAAGVPWRARLDTRRTTGASPRDRRDPQGR